jgi:phosphoglycolate phosphatase-like HAD superfamily hydrolase
MLRGLERTIARAPLSRRSFLRVGGALSLGGFAAAWPTRAAPAAQPPTDADGLRQATDPLPSWNDGAVKRRILAFVRDVTDPSSPNAVPPRERIAVFDNDGTLWCERPIPFQGIFLFKRVDQLARSYPEWRTTQPYQAVLERDEARLRQLTPADLELLFAATHANMTPAQFELIVGSFLRVARHARFGVPYVALTYQPMIELLDLLHRHDFKAFICSGGGVDFIRVFSEDAYGIPRERVIGSSLQYRFRDTPNGPELRRVIADPARLVSNNEAAKPENIQLHVGRTPIVAVGNSDGDLAMMQLTDDRRGPFLNVLVHHDDGDREYAYDAGAERVLDVSRARGWAIASMKQDFKTVFRTSAASSFRQIP